MASDQGFPPQQQPRQPGSRQMMDPKPETRPRRPGTGRLADQVAIITGGDSGIGRSVAEHFAAEGAHVVIVYKQEDPDAVEAKAAVEEQGVRCELQRGDIGDKVFCESVVATTMKHFGRIDILVNNAAEQHVIEDVTDHDDEEMVRTFQTNILGTMRMTYAALGAMEDGARIINTVSVVPYKGHAQLLDYSATKGAQVAFTRSLSQRLAERRIRVNAVAPGPIWTPLIPASFPSDKVKDFGTNTPLGRAGQPNEVAPAFVYLASEDSSYVTGQVIHVNGGTVVAA